jgi:cobalt-zinc-cadmium efflux system outer membrane protein
LALLLVASCARFESRPISPAQTAAAIEHRSLGDPGLRKFLEQTLKTSFSQWPPPSWDLDMLTVASFYYQPTLQVARAQLKIAEGGKVTAAQRPNPTVTATPGYDTTASPLSPWLPMVMIDVPIETMGKRRLRKDQAQHHLKAARLNLLAAAWQTRGEVRSNVVDYLAATQRELLLQQQVRIQQDIVKVQREQLEAGAISSTETLPFRLSAQRAGLDLADARRLRLEARVRLAASLGLTVQALEGVKITFNLNQDIPFPERLTGRDLRSAALQHRADVRASLADYAAVESALELEIAKQYPDVRLQPGYQFDQGDSKWTLGIVVDLPIFHQNQGLIAEAKARREEAAAKFIALQAALISELDRSAEVFNIYQGMLGDLRELHATLEARRASIEQQAEAGEIEKLELLNARLESAVAAIAELDGRVRLQQSIGAVESAMQQPFPFADAVLTDQHHADH